MLPWITLNIHVSGHGDSTLLIQMSRRTPDNRDVPRAPEVVPYDHSVLRSFSPESTEYGAQLGQVVFHGPNQEFLTETLERAVGANAFVRIRIITAVDSPHINDIRWERLVDPRSGNPLAIAHNIAVTRWVEGVEGVGFPSVETRPLKALIAIASPEDIEAGPWKLPPIDRDFELRQIRSALYPVLCHDLSQKGCVTASRLAEALHEGFDILYLIAHGVRGTNGIHFLLEDEVGNAATVGPYDLANRIAGDHGPRLVLLGSCWSANHPTAANRLAPATLAPSLIQNGTPVVVGWNDMVPLDTARRFFGHFVKELRVGPDIDRATTSARRQLNNESRQWSIPVVFSSITDGDIRWSPTAFKETPKEDFPFWGDLCEAVLKQECTPIVGPGVLDSAPIEAHNFIIDLSQKYRFPLLKQERPIVTKYLGSRFGRAELLKELDDAMRSQLLANARGAGLAPDPAATLPELATELARYRAKNDPDDLLRVLAGLPLPLYITTDPFDTLEGVLRDAGREPASDYPRWKNSLMPPLPVPTAEWAGISRNPLVYHLFGRWEDPESLLITEDDLIEFLMSGHKREVIPVQVQAWLRRSMLLFAGFPLQDFESHVVFKTLMPGGARNRPGQRIHVAAQAQPDETWARRGAEADAEAYFTTYFRQASVEVSWGSVKAFSRQLRKRVEGRA
jgi:hypothetical protein